MTKNCEIKLQNSDLLKILMWNNIASHNAKNLKYEFDQVNPNNIICKWEENVEVQNSNNPVIR